MLASMQVAELMQMAGKAARAACRHLRWEERHRGIVSEQCSKHAQGGVIRGGLAHRCEDACRASRSQSRPAEHLLERGPPKAWTMPVPSRSMDHEEGTSLVEREEQVVVAAQERRWR